MMLRRLPLMLRRLNSFSRNIEVFDNSLTHWKIDESENIGEQGLEKLFADLGVDASDVISLILAWQFKSKEMGEISETEFVEGMKTMRLD